MAELENSVDIKRELSWSSLGVPQKCIKPTPKLFYNKYAFKADIKISGANLCSTARRFKGYSEFASYINSRKSGRTCDTNGTPPISAKKLYSIFEIAKQCGKKIRVRGEGSHLSICADTEETLFDILTKLKLREMIETIFRPANKEALKKLTEQNVIFVSKPKFKFRAMIKGKYYKVDVKKQILRYFENYKDSITVSDTILYSLGRDYDGYVQGYFHVDNTDVLLFLKMIHPQFLGKIFTLESTELNS